MGLILSTKKFIHWVAGRNWNYYPRSKPRLIFLFWLLELLNSGSAGGGGEAVMLRSSTKISAAWTWVHSAKCYSVNKQIRIRFSPMVTTDQPMRIPKGSNGDSCKYIFHQDQGAGFFSFPQQSSSNIYIYQISAWPIVEKARVLWKACRFRK